MKGFNILYPSTLLIGVHTAQYKKVTVPPLAFLPLKHT